MRAPPSLQFVRDAPIRDVGGSARPMKSPRQKTTALCEPVHICLAYGLLSVRSLASAAHLTLGVHRGSQMSTIKIVAVGLGIGLVLAVFTNFVLDAALVLAWLIA